MSVPSPVLEPACLHPATQLERAKHPESIVAVDELILPTGSESETTSSEQGETLSTDNDDLNTSSSWAKQEYRVLETPSRAPRRLKVITIGAGASALNFAHEVSTSDLDLDLVCYEKNPEIGGTWFENKYPGCACDIPSVNYQLSWAPAVWSTYYSTAPEILAYFKKVADDYGLREYIRLSHKIIEAVWDEVSQEWLVKVEDLTTGRVISDRCNVLINAAGVLNKWKWPAIKGRETFKGPMLHSANWDDSVVLEGKRVAVIGGGSSAVQIVPNIQPIVGSMKCFVRTTCWVTAG
jgi:cation diffusion facilitator CzcD-associated flavoprotein CzcO